MLGPAGDALMLFVGIIGGAALTFRLWYPPLARLFEDTRADIEETPTPRRRSHHTRP